MRKNLIVLISLAFVMTACLPSQSPADVQAQVETAVAQTMEAQQQIENAVAQTVEAQGALASPTTVADALTPTLTATPIFFPTLTPVVATVTPISVPSGGGSGGSTVKKPLYACDVIHQRPFDNSEIIHDGDFDIKWTILNTGTKTWAAGVDVKYFSGPKMTTTTVVQIPKEMKPNDQFDIVLDAKAPSEKGFQVMTWVVDGQYCYPYIAIYVK
ncbi:MAG: NBR1-Ig-like domain-containing protein [Anaerolineales bacterium]